MSASHNGGLPIILMGLVMFAGSLNVFFRRLRKIDFFLGYGQALESFLVFVKFQYFLMFAFGATLLKQDPFFIAFSAIELTERQWFCIPFLLAWLPGFVGLLLKGRQDPRAKFYRVTGASFGFMIWLFVLTENIILGVYLAGVNPWVLAGLIASLWIIRRGLLDRPNLLTGEV
jgi:hypothetical protein